MNNLTITINIITAFTIYMLFVPTQIQHNYTLGLDVYNISVNVTNDVTPEPINVSRWIDVQEIILNISFVAKAIGTIDTISTHI